MADENEDQWLYGDSADVKDLSPANVLIENQQNESLSINTQDVSQILEEKKNDNVAERLPEMSENAGSLTEEGSLNNIQDENDSDANKNDTRETSIKEDGEAASDSDSDDDVHVVIGDIKSTPAYGSLNIKRGGLLTNASGVPDKLNKQPGKFSIDEFETIGVINGMPAHEFNLDQLEDKPWRQPGADITDYFNYGFNEETWRAYCERQKKMRSESGVGLILNAGGGGSNPGSMRVPQVAITNDNSKYSGIMGPKRAGPPPGRKMAGTIDVIGSSGLASRRNLDKSPPKGNVIQVMTADRREYSRKPGFPDMSVPPPGAGLPPPFDMPPPGYSGEPAPFYMPEADPYYQSYEPTQDSQWGNDPTWQPTNLAIPMTEGEEDKDMGPKTIPTMVPPISMPPLLPPRDQRDIRGDRERDRDRDRERERDMDSMGRERERDKDRERDREREKDSMIRDRDRERDSVARDEERDRDRSRSQYRHKERHRHRSRSRSRRHKSRSRSPSRRKKKSRRSDRERSKEESE
ncbi:PREDICTED: pre-mRNA 3'-end-processing factor FIP1 [Polistes canadensis]|uniref:pre-mRNA 3'-end-processing factor FIP1 n=1 Tax=Polistes canadensis TaxID=91411 RepID=UPI000718C59A|nr:PREDICTED: pre-mRNA 3'-end-processing factor FIP1 [Polistes canadensis]